MRPISQHDDAIMGSSLAIPEKVLPEYKNSHHKYWPTKELWEMAVHQGVSGGDYGALKFATERQSFMLNNARIAVDIDARWCDVQRVSGHYTEAGEPDYKNELSFLRGLAARRDEPLVGLIDDLPKAYWLASAFLKEVQVTCGREDFLTTTDDMEKLHRQGEVPRQYRKQGETVLLGDLEKASLRHWAEYVHADNPIIQWNHAVDMLMRSGCPTRSEVSLQPIMGNSRFGTGGPPYIEGAIGQVLRALAPMSFRGKWELVIPRPEQWAWENTNQLLPQVFPEGSPAHPSRDAMHYRAAQVIAYFVSLMFDPFHPMDDSLGNPSMVYRELQLMADNISFGRCSAGVHWLSDNDSDETCAAIAEDMMREIMGVEAQVLPEMRRLSFASMPGASNDSTGECAA